MRIQVDMPQLGESIVEGTIVEWHKKVGDQVREDEELFTITTDKVDTGVPAPQSGVLVEILADVDQVVEVGQPVAIIETDVANAQTDPTASKEEAAPKASEPAARAEEPAPAAAKEASQTDEQDDDAERVAMSPVARKMLSEAGVTDVSNIEGSGAQGRILKQDVEKFLESGQGKSESPAKGKEPALAHPVAPRPMSSPTSASVKQVQVPPMLTAAHEAVSAKPSNFGRPPAITQSPAARVTETRPNRPSQFNLPIVQAGQGAGLQVPVGPHDRVEPMSRSRVAIARNLSRARRSAVHCSTVWEADVTDMIAARKELKKDYGRTGVHLTYTPFFLAAIASALQAVPVLNAATDGENVIYRGQVNIGIASAWRDAMVVPTIQKANTLSLLGLARVVNEIQRRTEEEELRPTDLGQATFTLTNSGVLGARYGVPTLFPPQVGILSVGTIAKRVVVGEGDSLRVRSMVELCLTFDHRVVDFNDADAFMKHLVDYLQRSQW